MKFKFITALAALALAGPVGAAQIQFFTLDARWDNPSGGNIIDIDNGFGDPIDVCWGQDGLVCNVTSSGYNYDDVVTPFQENVDTQFDLGTFTHFNNVINAGTSINSVDLFIRGFINIVDGGGVVQEIGERIFSFRVSHEETPNGAEPCPYGDADDNANGCADQVTIETLSFTDVFTYEGLSYTLSILGFQTELGGAGEFTTTFISPEGGENERVLVAAFKTAEVPAPAALWLMIGGLGMIGFGRWKRS